MHGFPASPETQVTLANWRTAPYNRWAFQHVREIVPSADISNDADRVWHIKSSPLDLSGVSVDCESAGVLSFDQFLDYAHVDAMLVLHRDRLVYEHYRHGMSRATPHILMSVSKSLLGMLAGILEQQGALDTERLVTDYLPEVTDTAYRDATIRQLLDMRAGVEFAEDYLAKTGTIIDYRKATNWNPLEPGDEATDLRSFFRVLKERDGAHDGRFHYVSPNTDLLAWIIERATDRRYADLMSELLWRPIGMETNAYITVDRLGAPRAAGGVCTSARDLTRIARLFLHNGQREGISILPPEWIEDIERGGDRAAWDAGDFANDAPGLPLSYRSKWYVLHEDTPSVIAVGIHGQNIFIDRRREFAMVKFASCPAAIEDSVMPHWIAAAKAVRDTLSR